MKKYKVCFESLKIDPCFAFRLSDAEIDEIEKKIETRIKEIESIITAPDFCGCAYNNKSFWESVTKSTRTGETFQHTYFYQDKPSYHTSIEEGKTDKDRFFRDIAQNSFFRNLKLTVYVK